LYSSVVLEEGKSWLSRRSDDIFSHDYFSLLTAPNPGPSSERLLKQFGGTVHQGGSNFTRQTINAVGKVRLD
jgi:hypothetical protein